MSKTKGKSTTINRYAQLAMDLRDMRRRRSNTDKVRARIKKSIQRARRHNSR